MKQRYFRLVLCGLMISCVFLTSCNTKADSNSPSGDTSLDFSASDIITTEYNVELYSSDYVTIVCNSISSDKVDFSITSKLNNNTISATINCLAVDGLSPAAQSNYWGENSFIEIAPQETKNLCFYSYFNYTEHKTLSAHFDIFNDEGTGIETVDVVNFDLGATAHCEYGEPTGTLVYDDALLSINYVGADETGIRLRIKNKEMEYSVIAFDIPFFVNEKEYNDYVSAYYLPANSISDYYFKVKDYNPDYSPNAVSSFSCSGYTSRGVTLSKFNISSNIEVSPYTAENPTDTTASKNEQIINDIKVLMQPLDGSPVTVDDEIIEKVLEGRQKVSPKIGMTAEEVLDSTWGKPNDINKTTYAWGIHEQWCYSGYRYIYLEDGIVTAIQQ